MKDENFTRVAPQAVAQQPLELPRSPQPERSRHTPGPWTANLEGAHGNHAGGFSVETFIDGVGLFVICGRAGVPTRAVESHANARLIAAAPELLAALKLMESVYRLNCVAPGEPSSVLDAVQAAIAKAEGL